MKYFQIIRFSLFLFIAVFITIASQLYYAGDVYVSLFKAVIVALVIVYVLPSLFNSIIE